MGYDPMAVGMAVQQNSLPDLIAAFGANKARGAEWARESANCQIGIVATVLWLRAKGGMPIREPSGLRQALVDWRSMPDDARRDSAAMCALTCGFCPPKRKQDADPPQAGGGNDRASTGKETALQAIGQKVST
jgi:hypothetical protein